MLVLTRKIGEQIIVAGNIRISIVEVGLGRVKIGVDAPRSVTVDRGEIHDKKQGQEAPVGHIVEVPDIHDRFAETLLSADAPRLVAADPVKPLQLENRLKTHQHRLPRKPR